MKRDISLSLTISHYRSQRAAQRSRSGNRPLQFSEPLKRAADTDDTDVITSGDGRMLCFYLCLCVCLSVCLSAISLIKLWTDFDEISGGVGRGPWNNRLDFAGEPGASPNPGIL